MREVVLIGLAVATTVTGAIAAPPALERTLDGPSTLSIKVADHRQVLLRSGPE